MSFFKPVSRLPLILLNTLLVYKRFDLIHNGVIVDMITFEEPENYAKMPYAAKSLFCNIRRPLACRLAHYGSLIQSLFY